MSENRQNQRELALRNEPKGEARKPTEGTAARVAKREAKSPAPTDKLMEEVVDRANLRRAWKRVKANQGSPGVDGMTVFALKDYLNEHWPAIREQLLMGTYQPQPVQRVEIEKPEGGMRKLGIPTVVDRVIQQAVMQVLQNRWDGTFSDSSYGFRPGRSAHQAVARAQQYIAEGFTYVVDLDLEKFLDMASYCPLIHENCSNSGGC